MNKIGIVSCIYQNNYGSLLQSYATKEVLTSLGFECDFINYKSLKYVNKRKRRYFARQIFRIGYLKNKIPMFLQRIYIRTIKNTYTKNIKERYRAFDKYRRESFKTCPEFSELNMLSEYIYNNYHSLVVGSDQLWLPANVVAGFYSLSFINKPSEMKKVSFATSLGQSFIPKKLIEQYIKFLSDFDYISVREKEGAEILSNLIGRQVEVISDPVFLIPKEKWISLAGDNQSRDKKYVFCYFLGNSKRNLIKIKKYCVENDFEMIVLSNEERRCHEEKIADRIVYSISPFEFIQMIYSAELICTDSFHCVSFSIILDKRFVPFMKYSANDKYSTNGRLIELLKDFGYKFSYKENYEGAIIDLILEPMPSKEAVIAERMKNAESFLRKALG